MCAEDLRSGHLCPGHLRAGYHLQGQVQEVQDVQSCDDLRAENDLRAGDDLRAEDLRAEDLRSGDLRTGSGPLQAGDDLRSVDLCAEDLLQGEVQAAPLPQGEDLLRFYLRSGHLRPGDLRARGRSRQEGPGPQGRAAGAEARQEGLVELAARTDPRDLPGTDLGARGQSAGQRFPSWNLPCW